MARPRKKIDPEKVRQLASIHCTMIEIAAVMDCSVDTLERRFADIVKTGKAQGAASLRRRQWQAAKEGNATMLIWLGKQLLGQRDIQKFEHGGADGGPIEFIDAKEKLLGGLIQDPASEGEAPPDSGTQ